MVTALDSFESLGLNVARNPVVERLGHHITSCQFHIVSAEDRTVPWLNILLGFLFRHCPNVDIKLVHIFGLYVLHRFCHSHSPYGSILKPHPVHKRAQCGYTTYLLDL